MIEKLNYKTYSNSEVYLIIKINEIIEWINNQQKVDKNSLPRDIFKLNVERQETDTEHISHGMSPKVLRPDVCNHKLCDCVGEYCCRCGKMKDE